MLWGTTGATVLVAVVYLEQKWESIPFQTGLVFLLDWLLKAKEHNLSYYLTHSYRKVNSYLFKGH